MLTDTLTETNSVQDSNVMILKPEPQLSLPDSLAARNVPVTHLRTMRGNQQLGEGGRLLGMYF